MALNKMMRKVACLAAAVLTFFVLGCTVSYKFTGASIDYTRVKTVSLETFQNRAAYQWGPMSTMFNEALSDVFVQQTKLQQVQRGGDLQLAGEITGYDQFNKSISSDMRCPYRKESDVPPTSRNGANSSININRSIVVRRMGFTVLYCKLLCFIVEVLF